MLLFKDCMDYMKIHGNVKADWTVKYDAWPSVRQLPRTGLYLSHLYRVLKMTWERGMSDNVGNCCYTTDFAESHPHSYLMKVMVFFRDMCHPHN